MRFLKLLLVVTFLSMTNNLLADDLVRIETGVDSAWSSFGVDGSGVIIAILDRGIDYEHPDFINPDGSTRILYIYDMIDPSGANDPNNPFGIGTIYTQGAIDSALDSGVRLNTRDASGHGTPTTGIAAGNGAASGGLYAGMAPAAHIIAVKITTEGAPAHGSEPAEAPFYDPSYIAVAMDFVNSKADEAGMPVVLLANFGSSGGPMDGSSDIARALDSRYGPGITGKVFVTGSSDDGGTDNHAAGTISQGQTIDINISKTSNFVRFDLWYDENDRFDVEIITPNATYGPLTSPASNAQRGQIFNSEFNYYHNGSAVDFYVADNAKREIFIDFISGTGNYTVRLTGTQINNGSFQASLNPSTIFTANPNEFTSFVVPGHTVWDLAAAHNNITPNSYVLRPNWIDIDGFNRTFPGNDGGIGTLWTGSGIGPTWDGRTGVTVSVPGNTNFGAYGQRSYFNTLRFNKIATGGGFYGTLGAVSGAAPVLTGIIALMLDANPNLDAIQVRSILESTAKSDGFTGTTPNPTWGHGKVDAYAAVQEAINITGIQSEKEVVGKTFQLLGNYPNPFNPTTHIRYELIDAAPVSLKVYDLNGKLVRTLLDGDIQQNGYHEVSWDGRRDNGNQVASGVYIYRLQSKSFSAAGKAILLR